MLNLNKECVLVPELKNPDLSGFSCGDVDLDEFFLRDAKLYAQNLLGKTYFYVKMTESSVDVVAAFTLANDSVKAALVSKSIRNRLQRKIPNSKRMRNYPGMLIARLGVNTNLKGQHIGSQVIDYIKAWVIEPNNKGGCRFLLVDAYNRPDVIHFYERNDFRLMYDTEEEEKEVYDIQDKGPLRTRLMYYDLWYIAENNG
jgi:GNAT superfamily N-acetyltransferase